MPPTLAVLVFASSIGAASAQSNAQAVVAAERAFAAEAHERGIATAFLDFMDQARAIRLSPEPKSAAEFWKAQKVRTGPPYLTWRPIWAGASRCGDLGFTTGPYDYGGQAWGYYFTIWARAPARPDAPLRWVLDAGVERASDPQVPADAPVTYAAAASGRWPKAHPDAYWGQIDRADRTLDKALGGASSRRATAAYAQRLAPDARAMGLDLDDPVIGRAAVLSSVERRGVVAMAPLGSMVSRCGDLGVSWGTADWTSLGRLNNGDYVRVWRRAGARWTLLFEEIAKPG